MTADPLRPSEPFASFAEAVSFLESTLNLEKRTDWHYTKKLDLSRMHKLLAAMQDPHRGLRVVHLAGTKGKGTTAALLASCLTHAGCDTGLFTSPHLVSPCERIRINGQPISQQAFYLLLGRFRSYVERLQERQDKDTPTYFEILTAMGFEHFKRVGVDWAVVEVGLGGRLDSTNVVTPECCVITPIGFDHTDKLGTRAEQIAAEKAAIIKDGVPVVLAKQRYGEALDVLASAAEAYGAACWQVGRDVRILEKTPLVAPPGPTRLPALGWEFSVSTPLRRHENLTTPLLGAHQVENCATAIAALDMMQQSGKIRISRGEIVRGLGEFAWPARVQLLSYRPLAVLDGAHTLESFQATIQALQLHFPGRSLRLVFACSRGKDMRGMLALCAAHCTSIVATEANSVRALPAAEVARAAAELGIQDVRIMEDSVEAFKSALAQAAEEDLICVTGSFFAAGEIYEYWRSEHPDDAREG